MKKLTGDCEIDCQERCAYPGQFSECDTQPVRRAPVQSSREPNRPAGTVEWWEHELAWQDYAKRYGHQQSAERMAERAGFSYWELTDHLGHEPTTWKPR